MKGFSKVKGLVIASLCGLAAAFLYSIGHASWHAAEQKMEYAHAEEKRKKAPVVPSEKEAAENIRDRRPIASVRKNAFASPMGGVKQPFCNAPHIATTQSQGKHVVDTEPDALFKQAEAKKNEARASWLNRLRDPSYAIEDRYAACFFLGAFICLGMGVVYGETKEAFVMGTKVVVGWGGLLYSIYWYRHRYGKPAPVRTPDRLIVARQKAKAYFGESLPVLTISVIILTVLLLEAVFKKGWGVQKWAKVVVGIFLTVLFTGAAFITLWRGKEERERRKQEAKSDLAKARDEVWILEKTYGY